MMTAIKQERYEKEAVDINIEHAKHTPGYVKS